MTPADQTAETYHAHLLTSLNTINTHNPPVHTCSTGWSFNGLTSGPTSIAYLFYRLSTIYPDTFEFKGQGLLEWAESYVGLGGRMACGVDVLGGGSGRRSMEIEIGCDEMTTWNVVRGVIEGDEGCVAEVVGVGRKRMDGLMGVSNGIVGASEKGTGGFTLEDVGWWAGYLYLLRGLRRAFPGVRVAEVIQEISGQVVNMILACDEVRQGIMSTENLALMVGVITQVVLSRGQDYMDGLHEVLAKVVDLQDSQSGDWGASTAFIVNSLESIKTFLPQKSGLQQRVATAIERARSYLSQLNSGQATPTMQPDGLVTRALAFTDLDDQRFHDVLGELTSEYLDETRPGWKKDAGIKDEWVGLRTGEAGRSWVWAVAELSSKGNGDEIKRVERMILGYNDV